ncbi:MAG: hypothetical protein M3Q29_08645 [Chloroflexota bacterium]|nr:hypothetical protein [Chloroflexota bacterium]
MNWDSDWLYEPMQKPRVPIWVVGAWPRKASMLRAAHWDGVLPAKMNPNGSFGEVTPADVRDIKKFVAEHRSETTPYDIVIEGVTPSDDRDKSAAIVRPFAEAGATWWIESMWDVPGGLDAVRARIAQGPPSEH